MIKNYNNFITEKFTEIISSVYNFLKKVNNIDNIEAFQDDLLSFCRYHDIPLSKLSGEYLSTNKAIKKIKDNPNKEIGLFLFDLENYLSYISFKSNRDFIDNQYFELSDFVILVFIDEQPTGLKLLKYNRQENQEGSNLNKNDNWYKKQNLSRYKEILNKKRIPLQIENILELLIGHTNDEIYSILKSIKDALTEEVFVGVLNKMYELNKIDAEQYFKLFKYRKTGWY